MDGDDAGVAESGDRLGLAAEPLTNFGAVEQVLVGDFEGDEAVQRRIPRPPDGPEAAEAVARILGRRIRGGLVVSHGSGEMPSPFEVIRGTHPVPGAESERAGQRLPRRTGRHQQGIHPGQYLARLFHHFLPQRRERD